MTAFARSRAATLVACLSISAGAASLGRAPQARADGTAREKYWLDGDAKALASALAGSEDAADREDAALAARAADHALAGGAGTETSPLVRAVDALRRADLAAASAALPLDLATGPESDVRKSFVRALLDARRGKDDDALRRLVNGPMSVLSRDGARMALVFAALPDDDRDLEGGLLRAAISKAGAAGRADVVASLAEAAVAIDAEAGALALTYGARALRRMGRPADALSLLDGAAAVRSGRTRPLFRLERAILAWRRNDASTARTEIAASDGSVMPWAFAALSRAGACCAVIPAPPLLPHDGSDDADAHALARMLSTIGIASRAEDITTRAAAASTTPADPTFVRRHLESLGVARLETAGDPSVVEAALAKGLPVLVWRPSRDAEKFVDRPVLLRGHDLKTALLLADEPDPRRLDVFPASWLSKARALVVAPRARAQELAPWRDGVASRRGTFLFDGLAQLFSAKPEGAAAALATRPKEFETDVTLDEFTGYATYALALAARDAAGLAAASALLRRASATPPITAIERLMRAEAALGGEPDPALAELAEIVRDEGDAAWVEITRFVILKSGKRHVEALAALDRARRIDPLDVRTLYFRSGTRRLLGDGPGGRADLARVLERRPDHVPAAEDLVSSHIDDGAPERALAVVKALVAADPSVASTRRVHQLRQRVEARLVRKARSAEDLLPLAQSPEPEVRAEVAWTASSFETDAAERLLRTFLDDPDESVRRRAAMAYQRPSLCDRAGLDPSLLGALAARLASDPAAVVREALARALARCDAEGAMIALAARLAGAQADPAVGVRAAIADLFASRDRPLVKRALVLALADAESAVRGPAIRSLRRLTGTSNGFEPDDPPDRRAAAIAEWNRKLASGR